MKYYFHLLAWIVILTLGIDAGLFVHAQYEEKKQEESVQNAQPPVENKTTPNKEKYRWPLNIDNGFSSVFQEFRSSHFHGGLDLRTYRRTGYPVYAIADGHIYKIRMEKRGSGRGLYLRHDDGRISIYFHLDRFEEKIENVLKQVQQAKGRKYIENYFLKNPLPYKQGQIIGYSGETGSGFPHLHLEIRDKYYFALNPSQLIEFPAEDKNFPVLKGVLLRNRGNASINGAIGEHYFKFIKKEGDLYVLQQPLVITGNFDMILHTYDISDSGKHVAPYGISVLIDGNRYYRLIFDRFQRDDNNQLGFVYDMAYSNASSYYYNLFFQEGFLLEQENLPLPRIIETLDYGKHELRILVTDNHENSSTGIVPFYKVREPEFEVSNIIKTRSKDENKTKNQFQLQMDIEKLISDPSGEIKIYVYDPNDVKISSGALRNHSIPAKKNFILTEVPKEASRIDFAFYAFHILYFKKRFLLENDHLPSITDIAFDTFINRDEVFIKIKDTGLTSHNIGLRVIQDDKSQSVNPQCSGEHVYFRFTPRGIDANKPVLLHFSLLKENEKVVEIQKQLSLIYLEQGKKQHVEYHEFEAEFAVKAVYEPRLLQIEEKNYPSEYPVLSRQVSLSPYHFPFLDTVFYEFKKKLPNPQQVGIFKYNFRTGKWDYRYTTYESAAATYKHRLISSGIFALMRDIFPPRIGFVTPRAKYRKNLTQITVTITDKGKGVNDNTLKIWLNGKRICPAYECEYDPDRSSVKITDLRYLQAGKNVLEVRVKDYAGNSASRTLTFIPGS